MTLIIQLEELKKFRKAMHKNCNFAVALVDLACFLQDKSTDKLGVDWI